CEAGRQQQRNEGRAGFPNGREPRPGKSPKATQPSGDGVAQLVDPHAEEDATERPKNWDGDAELREDRRGGSRDGATFGIQPLIVPVSVPAQLRSESRQRRCWFG